MSMARQGRLHVPHATYYVVNDFRAGLEILVSPRGRHLDAAGTRRFEVNRRQFEAQLDYVCRRWCARVHAYCWLPRSALLLIEISEVPLESILRTLRGSYSHTLRSRPGFAPPVYDDRYRALLIDPEAYFLDFVRHIFWSPVNAGLCRDPLGYAYSSARVCVGEAAPRFLHSSRVAQALVARGAASRSAFLKFLFSEPSTHFPSLLAHGSKLDGRIAGGPPFVQEIRRRSAAAPRRVTVDEVILWVSARLGIGAEQIAGSSRHHLNVRARALVAWLSTCTGSISLREVGEHLSCGGSSLHRAIEHYLKTQPGLFSCEVLQEFEQSVR